ncbi:hypothetical protein pEaSNUABM29_00154 [Erwinia phage pEa_SNUABM_29]|nr:hypothetical protein pEaSNUABM29_00154 [Erwinia phage pEa_SNUABM_29]
MKVNPDPLNFFECLRQGKIPAVLVVNGAYSGQLASDVFAVMIDLPQFRPWFDTMDIVEVRAVYDGEEVPVVATRECLSRSEVMNLADSPKLVPSLFHSMCYSMTNKILPYEEVFAIVLDALHTLNYKHYKTLGTEH